MKRRDRWIGWMRAIEREYQVSEFALAILSNRLNDDPSLLKQIDCGWADYRNVIDNHAGNFVVRKFAEFETGLRELWRQYFRRTTEPRMADLLSSIASRRQVAFGDFQNADEVRIHRNALVHATDEAIVPMSVVEVRTALCKFFSYMPYTW